MDGCRGGAVYFARSRRIQVAGVSERDFNGEGLSFQMCRDVLIAGCAFDENSGNGLHPGAGSTNVLFKDCRGAKNGRCGFYFCVRANHITVIGSEFLQNVTAGVSVGTRDCYNLLDSCTMRDNQGPGIEFRDGRFPTEPHSVAVRGCRLLCNGLTGGPFDVAQGRREQGRTGGGQVRIGESAHDLVFEANRIEAHEEHPSAGFVVASTARDIFLSGNEFHGCRPGVDAQGGWQARTKPDFACGYGVAQPADYRHLPMSP
jgi:hypothetical protein